jgi:LuxR family transcriptional regulator of spore coat protein
MHASRIHSDLTKREHQVLALLVEGMSAKEIAIGLGIAPRTVECHIDHLRAKMQCRNRAQLIAFAVGIGIVMPAATA